MKLLLGMLYTCGGAVCLACCLQVHAEQLSSTAVAAEAAVAAAAASAADLARVASSSAGSHPASIPPGVSSGSSSFLRSEQLFIGTAVH